MDTGNVKFQTLTMGKEHIMTIKVRTYHEKDILEMIRIWNEVVEDGIAFPQEDFLTEETGPAFFLEQTDCGVAEDTDTGKICGMYILHPNNIGRCGFRVMQFNAVVSSNIHARHLYERVGFVPLGVIPGGFRMKDGHYEDICPYYRIL